MTFLSQVFQYHAVKYIVSRDHFERLDQHVKQAISAPDRSRILRPITTPYNHVILIRHAMLKSKNLSKGTLDPLAVLKLEQGYIGPPSKGTLDPLAVLYVLEQGYIGPPSKGTLDPLAVLYVLEQGYIGPPSKGTLDP